MARLSKSNSALRQREPITVGTVAANNYVDGVAQPFFLRINKTRWESLYPFTEGSATFEGDYYEKSNVAVFPGNLNPSQKIIGAIANCIF